MILNNFKSQKTLCPKKFIKIKKFMGVPEGCQENEL
tara:strand:+ start:752 stop:859 length:108 start_codon:yes stop_codon:yes gene_type:complete